LGTERQFGAALRPADFDDPAAARRGRFMPFVEL